LQTSYQGIDAAYRVSRQDRSGSMAPLYRSIANPGRTVAALHPSARSGSATATATSKASKPTIAPLDTPGNASAGASSGRAEVREVTVACGMQEDARLPLAEMVLDCTRRSFQDALKEAHASDAPMQAKCSSYRSGYGIRRQQERAQGEPSLPSLSFHNFV
jgi:hypothetical protein